MDYLHLIDNLTDADVDLLAIRQAQESSVPFSKVGKGNSTPATYTFTAKTTDYASRFRLVFSVSGDVDGDNAPFAFINNGNIFVNGDGMLQVIDMTGRVVVSCGGHTRCVPTMGFPAGVYVLRLIDGNTVRTQKIVIQ